MKKIICLLAAASVASGVEYDGLRVKFGWTGALADKEYFFSIPRTVSAAESEGWTRQERPPGPLPDLKMYCPPGRNVCPLYDISGFVAGLQVALPVDQFESSPIMKLEKKFVKWSAPATDVDPATEYWTTTEFFVSPESLKAGAGPQIENGATLQDGGVWVTGLDNRLLRIPSTEAELNSTDFKKQNCIPNMGIHYYYNMTEKLQCEDLLPWFALVTDGDLIGGGFQIIGKMPKQSPRDWFERPPSPMSAKMTIPFAPQCLYDLAGEYGVLSLHVYFVDKPWNIHCKTGDSAKLAPAFDRLILNGYRYATQIADEVKNLFTG